MATKSKPGFTAQAIAASKANLRKIRAIEKQIKDYNPILAWSLTPLTELVKLGPEIWVDVNEIFLKEKKRQTNIVPPGWDDVIKTGFDAPVSASEREAYRKYKKDGGKNPLSSAQEDTLTKRKERAQRIAQSPTPSSLNSIGNILTWVDDIQDSMVALAYVTRVAAKITGKFAPTLAKKWLMPLSYTMAAAEMLDLMRFFKAADAAADIARTKRLIDLERVLAAPEKIAALKSIESLVDQAAKRGGIYKAAEIEEIRRLSKRAGIIDNPRIMNAVELAEQSIARKVAGVAAGVARTQRKRDVYSALSAMPNLTSRQFKYLSKLKGILPSFAEAVQIAQVTAQMTGYGISLGAVVGYASDEVFGTLRGSKRKDIIDIKSLKQRLQDAQTHYPKDTKLRGLFTPENLNPAIKEYERLYKSPELTPLTMSAINILNVGANLMSVAGDLSVEDNLFVLTAVKRAYIYLGSQGALDGWETWSKPHLDLPAKPHAVPFEIQFEINEVAPDLVKPVYSLPFLDGVNSITPKLSSSLLPSLITESFPKWLKPLGKDMRVNYAMGLIADLAGDTFGAYEGPDEEMTTRLAPAGRTLMLLFDNGQAGELGTPAEIELLFTAQITDWLIRRQGKSPTYQEVAALINIFRNLYNL